MKVIVTGGAGFIGSHVVDALLARKYKVAIIDNFSTGLRENTRHLPPETEVCEADLSAPHVKWTRLLQKGDYVVHLAALADIVPSITNPTAYFRSNVDGTFYLVREAALKGVTRFVYAASSSCYGLASLFPTPETAPIQPTYPYALTKKLGEELVLHWAEVYRLPALSLRFFNVYGPRSRTSGTYGAMFGVFLAQKLANRPFTVVGDGNQTRDFIYVSDVADAVICAMESHTVGDVFNVGSGNTVSVNQIVELLGGQTVHIPKRPGEPECTHADITKIGRVLGWSPKISIHEGVKRLLNEIAYWKNAPLWTPESIARETEAWFAHLSRKESTWEK